MTERPRQKDTEYLSSWSMSRKKEKNQPFFSNPFLFQEKISIQRQSKSCFDWRVYTQRERNREIWRIRMTSVSFRGLGPWRLETRTEYSCCWHDDYLAVYPWRCNESSNRANWRFFSFFFNGGAVLTVSLA